MIERSVELEVIAGLKRGDEAAFDRIFEEYRPRLFSFIFHLIGRRDVAEDLTQELWLRLAARSRALRDDTRLGPWLFTVARNLCVSYWRSRGLSESAMNIKIELLEAPGSDRNALPRATETAELRQRIGHALAALPVRHREVLLLIGVEGMSPSDAAAVCGVKPEALRKRLERARKMFAEQLGIDKYGQSLQGARGMRGI